MVLEGIRRAMYAGSWYEADPEQLRQQLEQFLNNVTTQVDTKSVSPLAPDNPPLEHPVLAIVAPHAGYQFSGQAAAYAYKLVSGQPVKRVFLLGPSHHVGFHGGALPQQIVFQTPFGDLDVDKDVIAELKGYPLFAKMAQVHSVEHSLEMQLPFIRQVLGEVKLVPIVIGTLSDESEIRLMAEILKGYVARGDLVIVSSDFTHFGPRYDYQPFKSDIKEGIRKLDSRAFQLLSTRNLDHFLQFEAETKDTICGFFPCSVLAAMLPEGSKGTLLKYYTSADISSEETTNSVSYLAISFTGNNWPEHPGSTCKAAETIHLTETDKVALLKLARQTVETYVHTKKEPTASGLGIEVSPAMKQRLGVFVTLNKFAKSSQPGQATCESEQGRQLRGCIGYIWPLKTLDQAVIDNAISACSRDYRFNSVMPDELSSIKIEVSVLTPPRRVESYQDIVLGRDGIVLFKEGHQAVFLPHVAPMFGWDLPETLTQLSKKAGLSPDDWKEGCKFDVFQAELFEEH